MCLVGAALQGQADWVGTGPGVWLPWLDADQLAGPGRL